MLIDTSGLLCYQYSSESQHALALQLFESAGRKLTHSHVLAEFQALAAARRLNRVHAITFIRRIIDHPEVRVIWVDRSLIERALDLLEARPDKGYTLCDAISFVLMRDHRLEEALTTDHHFEQEGFRKLL